jgi:hypothetical protein
MITQASQPLTAADRCDRCGARARVRLELKTADNAQAELLFCSHHAHEHELEYKKVATHIHDERNKLVAVGQS